MEVPKCRVYICLITSAVPRLQVLGWAGGGGGGGGAVGGLGGVQTSNPKPYPTPRTLNPKPRALNQVFSGLGFKGVWEFSSLGSGVQGGVGQWFRVNSDSGTLKPQSPKTQSPKALYPKPL